MSSLAAATRYTSRPVEAMAPGSAAARSLGDVLAALLPPLCQQGSAIDAERSAAQESGGDGGAAGAAAAAAQAGQVERTGHSAAFLLACCMPLIANYCSGQLVALMAEVDDEGYLR